jgi:hypothetical protein
MFIKWVNEVLEKLDLFDGMNLSFEEKYVASFDKLRTLSLSKCKVNPCLR